MIMERNSKSCKSTLIIFFFVLDNDFKGLFGILIISNYNRGYGVEGINTIRERKELSNRKIEIFIQIKNWFPYES